MENENNKTALVIESEMFDQMLNLREAYWLFYRNMDGYYQNNRKMELSDLLSEMSLVTSDTGSYPIPGGVLQQFVEDFADMKMDVEKNGEHSQARMKFLDADGGYSEVTEDQLFASVRDKVNNKKSGLLQTIVEYFKGN